MNLRELAESDLAVTLEDSVNGFGWLVVLTKPDGTDSDGLVGSSVDISTLIDPETGQAVAGRNASFTLRISSVLAQFGELPIGIASSASKPWLITFDDINGNGPYTFKITETRPDRTLGVILCILGVYKNA